MFIWERERITGVFWHASHRSSQSWRWLHPGRQANCLETRVVDRRFTSAITGLLVQVDLNCVTLSLSLSSQLTCSQAMAGCQENERKTWRQSDGWASFQISELINFLVASSAMLTGEMIDISKKITCTEYVCDASVFYSRVINLWNKLSDSVVLATSASCFRQCLTRCIVNAGSDYLHRLDCWVCHSGYVFFVLWAPS